jgi:DNA-directed RNA polymerase specialized sigma24 family protein
MPWSVEGRSSFERARGWCAGRNQCAGVTIRSARCNVTIGTVSRSSTICDESEPLPGSSACPVCERMGAYAPGAFVLSNDCEFEVAHRALCHDDQDCWQALIERYTRLVVGWLHKSYVRNPAARDDLVAESWERFWCHFTPEKVARAHGIAGVLAYLKMCTRSAALDSARAVATHAARELTGLEAGGSSPEAKVVDDAMQEAFWREIQRHLWSEAERVLVHLVYELGLRSAEVQARRPDLFPDVRVVYGTHRRILDRLRRCDRLRAWRS